MENNLFGTEASGIFCSLLKMPTLGKVQISLAFLSLFVTFAP